MAARCTVATGGFPPTKCDRDKPPICEARDGSLGAAPTCGTFAAMSDDPPNPALLPAGLRDLLPPEAETEASAVEALMDVFAAHGYQRVKPPLLEFEDSLLAGSGAAVADQTFRLMDPDSQRMMGLRADTTPQVARIATTRLAGAPRPAAAVLCRAVPARARHPARAGPADRAGRHRADRLRQPRRRRRNRAGRRRRRWPRSG